MNWGERLTERWLSLPLRLSSSMPADHHDDRRPSRGLMKG
jgi:hypothetical protein